MPFLIAISISYFYSPKGYFIKDNKIHVHRKIGNTKGIPINQIQSLIYPATYPPGFTAGLLCIAGIFGAFGILWNKSWGIFQMYVTNNSNRMELLTKKGTHIILSPDAPQSFISEINKRLDGMNNV